MMEFVFSYGGIPSSDYGVYAFPNNANLDPPERNIEVIEVPGRNGDLTVDKENFKNRDAVIKCICHRYSEKYAGIREWLLSEAGYRKLENTRSPDIYMMARYNGMQLDKVSGESAVIEIKFSCKPQKFLKDGDFPIALVSTASVFNPTKFAGRPDITVKGTGTVQINNQTIQIIKNPSSITINGEELEAMAGDQNANGFVSLPDNPITLEPGENTISLSSGMTVEIIPHWWTL